MHRCHNFGYKIKYHLAAQKEIWCLMELPDMGVPICPAKAKTLLNVIKLKKTVPWRCILETRLCIFHSVVKAEL